MDVRKLLYTIDEACAVLGLSRTQLYTHMRSEKLAYVVFGTDRRIHIDELNRFAREGARGEKKTKRVGKHQSVAI